MNLEALIEKEQLKPLDKDTVLKMSFRPNLRYLYYDDIKQHDTLRTLLPKKNSGVLILFVQHGTKSKVGHFGLLFRNERSGLHFFEPYGLGLHQIIEITHSAAKMERLLKGTGAHINRHKYQIMSKGNRAINTCGRHCITRWNAANMTPKEYESLMHHRSLDPDEISVLLTMEQDLSTLKL